MKLREMSDEQLAERIVDYVIRCEILSSDIGKALEDHSPDFGGHEHRIREEYKKLKAEIREDAHEIRLRNTGDESALYLGFFAPSIREADAFGFQAPINHKIDQSMISSVEDARYKLTKYKSLKRWQELL